MAKNKKISLRDKTPKEKDDIQLLNKLNKYTEDWYGYYAENNENFKADKTSTYSRDGLWTDAEIKQYDVTEKRPRLTFNMLPKFITNVIGMWSTRGADLEVRAKNMNNVPQQNVDIYTNILRDISFNSRNNIVYKTALEDAGTGGYGAFLVNVEKESKLSFLHVVKYKAIQNPLTCGWDVKAREKDKSDGDVCFMGTEISKDEFKARYPGEPVPEEGSDDSYVDWVTKTGIVLMDMWVKEPITVSMSQLSDGTEVTTEKAEELIKENRKLIKQFPGEKKLEILKTEDMLDHKLMFYRRSKTKIYESKEWLDNELPIPFVPGILRWVDGEERTYSLVRWMIDAQRSYNYSRNEYLYRMMLQTYMKIMVTDENIGDHIETWKNPTRAKGPLRYNVGSHGEIPQVLPNQSVGDDLQKEMNRSLDDLQLISGRFDQNFGQQGNETSGVAINARRGAGNSNIKEFFDNIADVVERGAIITMGLIPKVYDSERNISSTSATGKQENVMINKMDDENSQLKDIQFTVRVKVGPNIDLQQQQEVQTLIGLTQSNPELHKLTDDLIAKSLDIDSSPQIVERIRRYNIPEIAAQEGSKDPIVLQQVQKQQQQQQQQQQMQLQLLQLKIKGVLQKMQIDQEKSKDDTVKAQASMLTSSANMLNAETNQAEAQVKGVVESQKAKAEIEKSQNELQIQLVELLKEVEKTQENVNPGDINQALNLGAIKP